MENQFDTDEQLRNALRDFEAIPDSGSFDAILEKMNRKKKRRFFIIFFLTGLIALSGIALPLMFKFYESAKSTASTATQAVPLAQQEASTHTTIHPLITSPDAGTSQALAPSTKMTSFFEIPNPEAKADPADSREPYARDASISSVSSPEKKSGTHIHQQRFAVTGHTSESAQKTHATAGSHKEAGTLQHTSSGNSQDKAITKQQAHTETIADVMYMTMRQTPMPVDSSRQDVSASLVEAAYPALFIAPEKKNNFSFYLGVQASPQLTRFAFSKNPHRDPVYNTTGIDFPGFYLNTKKDQRNFNFSLPFGVKAGVQINKKYEVLAGFGIQNFSEKEKLYAVSPTTVTPTNTSGMIYNAGPSYSIPNENRFRYLYYSLEANRLFQLSKAIGFKLGLGLSGNQLLNSNYVFAVSPNTYGQTLRGRENLSPWLLTTKVKAGLIFNANRRFQLHISPGFFYAPTSVFQKAYVIRQKPYGVDVECLLLFRLFKF